MYVCVCVCVCVQGGHMLVINDELYAQIVKEYRLTQCALNINLQYGYVNN